MPDLIKGRCNHSSVVMNMTIFVLGGDIGLGSFPSVIEMLDLRSNIEW